MYTGRVCVFSDAIYGIIVFTETWLNSEKDSEIIDTNVYTIWRRDREDTLSQNKDGGGVFIAVNNTYGSRRCFDYETLASKNYMYQICTIPAMTIHLIQSVLLMIQLILMVTNGEISWSLSDHGYVEPISWSGSEAERFINSFLHEHGLYQFNVNITCNDNVPDLVYSNIENIRCVCSDTVVICFMTFVWQQMKKAYHKRKFPLWYDADLICVLKEKEDVYRRLKRRHSTFAYFSQVRTAFHKTNSIKYREYLSGLESDIVRNPKKFWSYVSQKRKCSTTTSNQSKYGGEILDKSEDIANVFNDYFKSVFQPDDGAVAPLFLDVIHDAFGNISVSSFWPFNYFIHNITQVSGFMSICRICFKSMYVPLILIWH